MADHAATSDELRATMGAVDADLPQVWVFQPAVKHYRLPVWDLIAEQAARRYQLTVFGPLEIDHADIEQRHYLQAMPLHKRLFMGREVTHWRGAAKMVRQSRPDVVVVTASVAFLGSWTLPRVARRIGAAVVGWSKVNNRAGHTSWVERRLKRRFFRRFDLFLCYGECSRSELRELGYPESRIRIAQNTIDTRRIFDEREIIAARGEQLRQEQGLTGKKVLLCIGRMAPQKRQADLITAWHDLRNLDPDLVLVLVGRGELYEGLLQAADETDPDRIVFTGAVPEGDDYAWIAASDLVVIPGAVGLALNQSLAFGRPTIIADEPGADAELLRHGENGWRYPRGDIQALVAAVRHALLNPAEAARVGAAAVAAVQDKATIERMVETMDRTFMEAIHLSKKRRHKAKHRGA
jgi:glycosyltransferase involved in cell wall biosynthesis